MEIIDEREIRLSVVVHTLELGAVFFGTLPKATKPALFISTGVGNVMALSGEYAGCFYSPPTIQDYEPVRAVIHILPPEEKEDEKAD